MVLKSRSTLRILNCSFIRLGCDRFQTVSCSQCHSRLQINLVFQKQDEWQNSLTHSNSSRLVMTKVQWYRQGYHSICNDKLQSLRELNMMVPRAVLHFCYRTKIIVEPEVSKKNIYIKPLLIFTFKQKLVDLDSLYVITSLNEASISSLMLHLVCCFGVSGFSYGF